MGLLSMFRKLSGGAEPSGSRRVVIDASRWPDGRGSDRQSPRDQVQALQQISRFVRQEKLEAQVAFEGRALREVSEDGDYNGLKVFFAEKQGGVGDLVIRLIQRAGPRGLLVFTADAALEKKAAALGAATMHLSTLRKALEGGAGGEQPENYGGRGGGDRERGGRGRRFDRRPPREGGSGGRGGDRERGGRGPAPSADAEAGSAQHSAAVRSLIDLVEEPVRPATPPPATAAAPAPQPPPPPAPVAPAPAPEPPPQS